MISKFFHLSYVSQRAVEWEEKCRNWRDVGEIRV